MLEKQSKICLVDDEKDVLDGLTYALQEYYQVKPFISAQEALDAFDKGYSPAVVVTDLRMPKMNGLEFIEKIKEHNYDCKVLISSGHADKKSVVDALNLGAHSLLEKPSTIKQMKQTIDALLKTNSISIEREVNFHLKELSSLYFQRLNKAENFIHSLGLSYPSLPMEKMEFIEAIKKERLLMNLIDRIERGI